MILSDLRVSSFMTNHNCANLVVRIYMQFMLDCHINNFVHNLHDYATSFKF